jgi:hypothetical protein
MNLGLNVILSVSPGQRNMNKWGIRKKNVSNSKAKFYDE